MKADPLRRCTIAALLPAALLAGCGYQDIPKAENAVAASWADSLNSSSRSGSAIRNVATPDSTQLFRRIRTNRTTCGG